VEADRGREGGHVHGHQVVGVQGVRLGEEHPGGAEGVPGHGLIQLAAQRLPFVSTS